MTNEQILKKAILKAVKGGWKEPIDIKPSKSGGIDYNIFLASINCVPPCIYNHDFAKAFWGDEEFGWFSGYNEWSKFEKRDLREDSDLTELRLKEWQYHLQQLVLREEPLKYIEKYL